MIFHFPKHMPFQENEYVYLVDQNGNKHWMKISYGMMKISSLGTVDGSRFKEMDDGSQFSISNKKFTVFRPTAAELIESLDRGAQIIISKDAASIIFNCGIKSGSKVLEIGAGSGGLTTALLSAVAPEGCVHTVDLSEENALRTQKNIKRTGLDKYWSYQVGDAKNVKIDFMADAMTIDMPGPEEALDNLFPHLVSGGKIAIYVPNTNQLEAAVEKLRELDFCDVFAIELIQREMVVHAGGVRPSYDMLGHTGYLAYGRKREHQ